MQPETFVAGRYGQYTLCIAELAKAVCEKAGIHNDSAKQACFATLMIDAEKHLIFMSESKKDRETAVKADAQIKEIDPNPTPEKAENAKKVQLIEGINKLRATLNKEGIIPTLTESGLNTFIKSELNLDDDLIALDGDALEIVIQALSIKLDHLREENKKPKSTTDVGF
jgi:hypothetical protein